MSIWIVFELSGDSTLPALSSARKRIVVVELIGIAPLYTGLEAVGAEPSSV